jgi:ActR/RegA family two-component response regulator
MQHSVIVVEDDPAFAEAVRTHLKCAGFDVETAADTIVALEMVDARRFDMHLVDLAMPRGKPSGLSFARMVRYLQPAARMMFISGYPELAEAARQLDCKVFTKPANLDAVTAEILSELTATPAREEAYLLARAEEFRKLADDCEPSIADRLRQVAADLVLKTEEIARKGRQAQ